MLIDLEPKLEQRIQHTAKMLDISPSELVQESILEYLGKQLNSSPWELGQDYFGKYSSGQGNLASDRKRLLKSKLIAKNNEKNSD